MKIINKPWGREEWLELNDKYCYKRLYINAGYKTSYQYHIKKYETNYIISGTAEIWLENDNGVVEKKVMNTGDYFNVSPPKKHRVIALTDLILQEVSTPEVDDVIRIEDDTNRADGKLEGEHKTPAVLILAAGLGTRVRKLAQNKNKTLIPINNKAIISYIIEKFPKEYEIVMAVGYKKESLIEYCKLAYPNRKFTFEEVSGWDDSNVGPGTSTLACKKHLQRPFYLITADTIIDCPLPHLDGNWVGISPTVFPEKYSTIRIDRHQNVIEFVNKSTFGYENAFMGLAGIRDYNIFWDELEESSKNNSELVSVWFRPEKWPNLKVKSLEWLDTGNLDDIQRAKEYFKDKPLSLFKNIDDVAYKVDNKFLKFSSDININKNRYERGLILKHHIPNNLIKTDYFIAYDWEDGDTLYTTDSFDVYYEFLLWYEKVIDFSNKYLNPKLIEPFYVDKTNLRKNKFLEKYGNEFYTTEFTINGKKYPSLKTLFNKIDFNSFTQNPFYGSFHGDLQFDNILINSNRRNKFFYIDWRDSFAESTEGGDLYYDLAKLYGGCDLSYYLLKNDSNIKILEGISMVDYSYTTTHNLTKFKSKYEMWITKSGFSLDKIKLIKSLIFLNMSPLHSDKFNKLLWFKAIEGLYECFDK